MVNKKAATRSKVNSPMFLYIHDMKQDLPVITKFADLCEMPDCFEWTEPSQALLDKITKANLTAQIHVLKPGQIERQWSGMPGSTTLTVPDVKLDGTWHVIIETLKGWLVPGWLLTACGHYVEQIASGNGYKAGKYELRGTSFDQAVTLASLVSGVDSENWDLRQTADGLVAILNGAWLAWYCGIEPSHSAVELMTMVVGETGNAEKVGASLIEKFEDILANSIMQRHFYEKHVEQIGWNNEKSMCLTLDAATSLLLRQMTLSLKDGK